MESGAVPVGGRPDADTADFSVVWALLTCGRSYERTVEAPEPYREIRETDEVAMPRGYPSHVEPPDQSP